MYWNFVTFQNLCLWLGWRMWLLYHAHKPQIRCWRDRGHSGASQSLVKRLHLNDNFPSGWMSSPQHSTGRKICTAMVLAIWTAHLGKHQVWNIKFWHFHFAKGSSIIIIIYAYDKFYRKREGGWKMINIITTSIYSDDYMLYDLSR